MSTQFPPGQALAARLASAWQVAERRVDAARPALGERAWKYFMAAGLVMTVGYFFLGSVVQNLVYQIPETLAVLAVLTGVAIHRPADPRPWLTLAGGLTLTTLGDWTWVVLDAMGQDPFPSIADLFYLAGVALIIAALLLLVRGRVPGGDRSSLIDALIVAAGVGMLTWVFLMHPLTTDPTQSFGDVSVALAYPIADVLLLGVLARLFLVPGKRVDAFYLLVGALVAQLASDYIYAFQAIDGTYQTGQLVDAGWLMSFCFWGTAALHPSMRQVARPLEHGEIGFSFWRLALLGGASLMAPAVLVIEWVTGADLNIPVIAAGCVVLFLLVIARLGGVVLDLRTTLSQRKVLEAELERRSLTDPLTGLPNRVLFYDRLEHALAQRERKAAVLFVDLDDFKTVNDAYGHEAGDIVLRAIAESIRRAVRPGDTPARLGGDEFAVLVEGGLDTYQVGALAERVLAAVAAPILIQTSAGDSRDYLIGASIGISHGAGGSADGQQLMREADIAMYVAKGQGKGRFCVFEPATHAPVVRSLELRTDLEEAIRSKQFELHYQPIIDLATGGLAGMEALVRWRHPHRGLLMPADFIPLAEATGSIVPLGKWILDEACREAVTWSAITPTSAAALGVAPEAEGEPPPSVQAPSPAQQRVWPTLQPPRPDQPAWAPSRRRPFMSVNLSAVQLSDETFAGSAAELLRSVGLSPRDLVLETTESTRFDQDSASVALRQIRTTGIRLAIDDFGTGYASLSQLRRIPFDIVKIDPSFVHALGPGSRGESLIAGIVDLARKLNILVIAEGIETAEQLGRLRQMGCALGQGYYFAEPMPAPELRALLGLPQPPRRRASTPRQPTFVTRPLPKAGT